jgi:uncharacterized protein (TIGR02996 family)
MGTLVETLESCAAALDREDLAAALAEIIAAWRIQHHSRIGELAGRISALAGAARPAISGKTVKARFAAWLEAEPARDLVDVERLLADPWPTQWRDGEKRFDRIVKWAPDPRVGAFLTRAFVDPPYDSQASYTLRIRLLRHLVSLEDPRSLVAIEKTVSDFARFYDSARAIQRGMPTWAEAIAQIEKLEPDVEGRIVALEARFASAVRSETSTKKTADEFLAAIYAEPEDIAHKTVFADWLSENGDPRGELIALQLAGQNTPRERALIAKFGDDHSTFDWPIAENFKRGTRRYEDGFFAGGQLESRRAPALDHPGWSHVRAIALESPDYSDTTFLAQCPRLREVTNIRAQEVLPLLGESAIEVLEIVETPRDDAPALDANHPIATTNKLRSLKALGVACARWRGSVIGSLPTWPILRRLERVMLRNTDGNVGVPELLAQLVGPKAVEVRPDRWAADMDEAKTVYRLERPESTGPFRRIWLRGTYHDIATVLDSFPENSFDFIGIDLKRAQLRVSERERMVAAVARFPNATIDPPFEDAPARPKFEVAAKLTLRVSGAHFNAPENIARAMGYAADLGVIFDSYSVGWGNQHRALKPDPVKKAVAMTKPDKTMSLYRDGTESQLRLGTRGDEDDFALELGPAEVARAVDWAIAMAADGANRIDTLSIAVEVPGADRIDFSVARDAGNPFNVWPDPSAFAVMLDEPWSNRLSAARWKKHLPSDSTFFFREVGNRRLVGLHSDPLVPPTIEEHQEFARLVQLMVGDVWEETHGFRWRELVHDVLGPTLKELGLHKTTKPSPHWLSIKYGDTLHVQRFAVTIQNPFSAAPVLVAALEAHPSAGGGWYTHELANGPASDARGLLEKAAAKALEDRAWLENPAPPQRRRR